MNPKKKNILIILPAYNESSVIEDVIFQVQKKGFQHICVVDDGSTDNTSKKARNTGAVVLSHPVNRGAGAAVQTGLAYARKNNFQYAITMDSDGQHSADDADLLLGKMQESGADIVIGNRFVSNSNDIPVKRIVYNRIANSLTNLFCKNNYNDTQSGFRLFNRIAIEKLNLKNREYGFCSEMLIAAEQNKLQVVETPIQVIYTPYSLSKGQGFAVGVRTASNFLWHIIFR